MKMYSVKEMRARLISLKMARKLRKFFLNREWVRLPRPFKETKEVHHD